MAPWAIAVFCRNEADMLDGCLRHLAIETNKYEDILIYVIINGSTDKTKIIAEEHKKLFHNNFKILEIKFPDKTNSINQYIHLDGLTADIFFFIDGYARISEYSLRNMAATLMACPMANAVGAFPLAGRSAAAQRQSMREYRDFHGSLFGLRGTFVERIRSQNLRLPVGLYRGDGLLGSMVRYDLDAVGDAWIPERVVLCESAGWTVPQPSALKIKDYIRFFRRRVQQARGRIEISAINRIISANNFSGLPKYADDMLIEYLRNDPLPIGNKFKIFTYLALRRLKYPRRPAPADLAFK